MTRGARAALRMEMMAESISPNLALTESPLNRSVHIPCPLGIARQSNRGIEVWRLNGNDNRRSSIV